MYLVINKWVIALKVSNFSGHYLRNRSTLGIGVLGYIGIVWPKEHPPEVWHIPPGTPCILNILILATGLWNRMTLLFGRSIDQHVKRKRICKSVARFGVAELAKHYRLWRREMSRNNQSCGCQRNKIPTPLVSQQCSDDGSWDLVSILTQMETTTRKELRADWTHWNNDQNIWSSHFLPKCSKISCQIITSSISNTE